LAAYVLWLLIACLYILRQRRPPTATLAWIIAFISLPVIGAVVYFFFGPRKLRRRRVRRTLAKVLAAQVKPGESPPLPDKLADRIWLTALARVACASGDALPRPTRSLTLFAGGDETFEAIESAVRAARGQVHLEYYIFEPDAIGTRLRDTLTERASAGVQVRVLVDALGSKNAKPAFWEPLVAAGGQVRRFNPPRLLRLQPGYLNFRTHRKIVVVDGLHAFTGGINISAGNSALSSGGTAWRDTHIELRGAPAQDLQVMFLEDWIYAGEESAGSGDGEAARAARAALEAEAPLWFPVPPAGQGPWVQIIDSGPDEDISDIYRYYFTAITSARRRLWITTPYFVPDEAILLAIVTAAARGVDVRVILPREGDSQLVTAAASTFADDAVAQGVPVFEYCGRMIHAKTMVVDDELAVVGTANLDNRSFHLNFEVIAAIYDRGVVEQLARLFEEDLKSCEPVDATRNEGRAPRLFASLARLLAPVL
jgi:cardiolipin synthase